jgi:predicted metal-binding membrane protein
MARDMTALASILRRDRAIVAAGLAGIVVLAWLYLLRLAGDMAEMGRHAAMGMAMPQTQAWDLVDLVFLFLMWAVMMLAMMVPSAAPMILLYTAVNRRRAEPQQAAVRMGVFVLGYLVVWTAYSALAASAQWGLHAAALLSPMMALTSRYLGGALLIAAGVFQWTPLKEACLSTCRSPLGFLMSEWRDRVTGAWVMGLRHGAYCVGCCWALMTLLFVAGVMNLVWVAAIAAFVLVEKVVPGGQRVSRVAGSLFVVVGILMLILR